MNSLNALYMGGPHTVYMLGALLMGDRRVHGPSVRGLLPNASPTQPFYSFLEFVWDNPGELVPEGTFRHLLDFLEQNEDNTGRCTNNPDGLPPYPD